MEDKKRYSIKNILLATLWIAISAGAIVLLVAAVRKKDSKQCKKVEIEIKGVNNNFFVDDKDVLAIVSEIQNGDPVGKPVGSFELRKIETALEKSTWIRAAELFFDNNEVLRINITEREPIARIFTLTGSTFYIDSAVKILPVNDKFSARLPVFTSFPSEEKRLSGDDSVLLQSIKQLSIAIQKDSFRMAMIDQVDITPQRNFEMIPKLGNQVIVFGDATDAENKFDKLKLFYKDVMTKAGWNKYSVINLQYKNQVVAKIRGAEDKTSDSLKTLQTMQLIADNAERQSLDSSKTMLPDNDKSGTDSTMVQQSIQRDYENEGEAVDNKPEASIAAETKPAESKPAVVKPVVVKPIIAKPIVVKPIAKPVVIKKTAATNAKPAEKPKPKPEKPKVTMPKRDKPRNNDY